MNYLAHALLAGDDPADRLGGVIGDFVKGPLPAGLPAEVAAGVALHRAIDTYADRHPAFQRSRARVSPERRRVAGIMIDMFYDHFLTVHWARFHAEPLPQFTAGVYALMGEHQNLLPPRLITLYPYMRDDDWLASYRSATVIGHALDRMSARLTRTDLLTGSGVELLDSYEGYEADFLAFLPDAVAFAAGWRTGR